MNQDEFASRVSCCRAKLLAIARRMLPAGECEDAVQSTVLAAWEHLSQLKDETAFEAWLTQILMNQCRQMLRQRKKEKDTAKELASQQREHPEELYLHDAFAQMKPEERKLLLMHHEEGYSVSEIAKQTRASEAAVKMRLYRARKSLRMILISLLLLLLLASAAIGSGLLDIGWFLKNRRANPSEDTYTDFGSVNSISYSGLYLTAELNDVKWNTEWLELLVSYAIVGTDEQALTVHSGNIGVDGERFDHIWIDNEIIPVSLWADGKDVYTYYLDGWCANGTYLSGSEDFLPDGKGEAFMAQLRLDCCDPLAYATMLSEDGTLTLTSRVVVSNYATGEIIEEGQLTLCVGAPDTKAWREAYEALYR